MPLLRLTRHAHFADRPDVMAPKLGIIAGGGPLPGQLVDACRRQGRDVFVLALKGHADPAVIGDAPHSWVRMGAAGEAFRLLRANDCKEICMIGPVRRPTLTDLRPDWRAARFFARVGARAMGDDSLLRAVIREIEGEGFLVVGADSVLDDLLVPFGRLGRVEPDEQAEADIRRGVEVARGIGLLDVGQSVVVQQGIVLGVEAVEGTDALLTRCASLGREGPGGVMVKLRKPQQEGRADLPTIGIDTVEGAHRAGLRGIAVTAGGTIIVDRAGTISRADALGLFVVGLKDEQP